MTDTGWAGQLGAMLCKMLELSVASYGSTFHVPLRLTPKTVEEISSGKVNRPISELNKVHMAEKRMAMDLIEGFAFSVKHHLRGEIGIYYEDLYKLVRPMHDMTTTHELPLVPQSVNLGRPSVSQPRSLILGQQQLVPHSHLMPMVFSTQTTPCDALVQTADVLVRQECHIRQTFPTRVKAVHFSRLIKNRLKVLKFHGNSSLSLVYLRL